jgi:hypothetical protein
LRTVDELDAFRSIPGTTLSKYLNRTLSTVDDFLKGLIVGTAISEHVEDSEIEDYISEEVAKRMKDMMIELNDRSS